ncbi:YidC/Oxa1 family membrane protein insertase [Streptomyces sp. LP05-1]|uniref:Membrane protein insertase YidC n=1 Tax=Streptomyces pyxinae TaxID=2970734 RepID=A0ABT2CB71_9ACTN|nr:YidC/Oxa1 family membrane protein insertase [Streptomyces sp. LP05-1]MCS0634634.1 YidC/Oxa1 family membrane protein insertase [Streptomyces sp. LP05-1]
MSVFASLLEQLSALLQPFFPASATAAAIVLFTALVRLALLPLSRAAARGQRARARLAPRMAELRKRHAKDPERLAREVRKLHVDEGVSPFAGVLPSLLQVPAFLLMFHLFGGGRTSGHQLLGAPLGGRWADALGDGGPLGAAGLVYLGLFALVAAVATYSYRRAKRELADLPVAGMPGARFMPLLSFGTLVTVAVVPLAAALYVVTSTTWTAAERAVLYRKPRGEPGAPGVTGEPGGPGTPGDPGKAATAR